MVQVSDFESWEIEDMLPGLEAVKEYPISFILPLSQVVDSVPAIMTRVSRFLGAAKWNAEVIVVDDASKDGSGKACAPWRQFFDSLTVIRHSESHGRGAAARTGVLLSSGKIVVVVDPLGDTPLEDSLELLHSIKRGADLAVASRRVPGAALQGTAGFLERVSETAFTALSKLLVPVGIRDSGTELIAMRRRTAREVVQRSKINGDVFAHEWVALAERLGHRVDEVPVTCLGEKTDGSRRRYNELAMLRDVWRLRRHLGKDQLPRAQTARDLLRRTSFTRLDRRALGGARRA